MERLARGTGKGHLRGVDRRLVEIARGGGIDGLLVVRQEPREQAGEAAQGQDEEEGEGEIEGGVEIGDLARRIGVEVREEICDRMEEGKHERHADDAIDEVAKREPTAGTPAAPAALDHGIDRAAEVGAEDQGQRRRG